MTAFANVAEVASSDKKVARLAMVLRSRIPAVKKTLRTWLRVMYYGGDTIRTVHTYLNSRIAKNNRVENAKVNTAARSLHLVVPVPYR